ncbi:MYXO-CTERM sorting domain-containing protein [Nannocystis pusilla]|uniref:MYXO-CTERM sorting domain-containing protein n=1 Tax=Nannocystis pusilla TaxID=889268 RepID=UPI003B7CA333
MEDDDAPLIGRTSVPFAARAVARDDAGDPVVGLPVTWSAEAGNMAYWPELTPPESIVLSDDCIAPEDRDGPRELVLRARHGDVSASLEFAWAGTRELSPFNFVENDSSWKPPDTCLAPAGCGCRSGEPAGGAALLLGLLLLGRRRRKSPVRTGMLAGTCLLALPGCGGPPSLSVAEALPLGDLPLRRQVELPTVQGGHSVAVGDRALWAFRTTSSVSGLYGATSAAAVTADFDARDGLHPFSAYGTADEGDDELLPLLAGERGYKKEYVDGECTVADDYPRVSFGQARWSTTPSGSAC